MQLHRRLLWIPALATLTCLLFSQLYPELPKMPISGYLHRPRREVVEYKSSRGFGQRLVKYRNFTFPVEYKDIIVHMNAYLRKPPEARVDDVWLINYPKSGTHFLWEIVSMLVRNTLKMNPTEKERAMCPELVLPDHVDNMASPRVLNTHVPPRFFSTEARNVSKFLYLIRNPKDVFVSYYFHRKNLSGFKGAFEDFLELVYRGHAGYGRWIDHVKDWLAVMKDKPNFLIVKYENLVKEPLSEVRKIAQFIGFKREESFYQSLAIKCSFANMKKHKVRKRQKYELFYRNGTVGNWKNFFTTEQNLEFEKRLGEELKDLPFALDFE
ncbi:sulfotransferase 1C2 isoform X2 [Lingula anatina]|uniref:Sulfotransferase 1C2 isoform X2 n=1 Tax=Lingula anatina TaxID=7574 RepID=A0A1S3JQ47_LINAN|nr:sulfotransferase 1C2 isoform X2 [Lingula anatina]|eukprot:XP_013412492.1 sulfotransferase 1C2 isoform X2 [Lingula anatina]